MNSLESKVGFFDKPENLRKLWIALYAVCAVLAIADLLLPPVPHFAFDGFIGFYPLLGLASSAVLILLSKVAGFFLKAPENYYE